MTEQIKRDPEKGLIIWGSGGDATLEKGPEYFIKDGIEYARIYFTASENLRTLYNIQDDDFIGDGKGGYLPYIFKDYPKYFIHTCGDFKTPMVIVLCDWKGVPLPEIIKKIPIQMEEIKDETGKVISTKYISSLKPFGYIEVVENLHVLQRQLAQKIAQLNQKDKEIDKLQENLKKRNLVQDIVDTLMPRIHEAMANKRGPSMGFYPPQ